MNTTAPSAACPPTPSQKNPKATVPNGAEVPVIPLMSKEEGERLISRMPKRSLQEALEMKEKMLGRSLPLAKGGKPK